MPTGPSTFCRGCGKQIPTPSEHYITQKDSNNEQIPIKGPVCQWCCLEMFFAVNTRCKCGKTLKLQYFIPILEIIHEIEEVNAP